MKQGMSKMNILYVDDETTNLRIFKNIFRRDYKIFTASSANEGLEIIEKNKINLVITDQRMPEMTGLEFLKQIHAKYSNHPPDCLMISGYSDQDAIDEAFRLYNLFAFIAKPWDADHLKEMIEGALTFHN
jgi:DNA-binding NtrC family response regulator